MTLSRKCVPFTPFDGELSQAAVAIVTAGGVHLRSRKLCNISDELGDLSFRIIPDDADPQNLIVSHHHYDHADADESEGRKGVNREPSTVTR